MYLLCLCASAQAATKILQYNPDGTVKGIVITKPGSQKKAPNTSSGSTRIGSANFSPMGRYTEGELLVINPSLHFVVNTKPLGFSILGKNQYRFLKLSVIRLGVPAKYTVPEAKKLLSGKFPRLNFTVNHTYDITGSTDMDLAQNFELAGFKAAPAQCGRGVRIGMIDSAVNVRHAALAGQRITNKRFNVKGAKPGPSSHGTAIAAMFVGTKPKQGLGGLLPAAEIKAANVQEQTPSRSILARASNIIKAIDWLISQKVHVINFNISGADNQALRLAVDRAQSHGVIMVAAVGNWDQSKEAAFPAAYASVISVTGVDKNQKVYSKANKGSYVDFAAKGVRLWAASSVRGGRYVSGTSFATPIVSSLVALEVAHAKKSSAESMRAHLKKFAVDLGASGRDSTYGWGGIDLQSVCQ